MAQADFNLTVNCVFWLYHDGVLDCLVDITNHDELEGMIHQLIAEHEGLA